MATFIISHNAIFILLVRRRSLSE